MGSKFIRQDKRAHDELRKINIHRDYMKYAEGSCLIEVGGTKVICTATIENTVPPFLRGKGTGWITAEYSMLPRSCAERVQRESHKGKLGGRTQEIQRLIGRSARAIVDMACLGEMTILLDCDVIQADGGTRTASITGSFVALVDALNKLKKDKVFKDIPLTDYVAAVSVGMIDDAPLLDLTYAEDSNAEVDMNIVMTRAGKFVEIQGTAERKPFSQKDMQALLALAKKGIMQIISIQKSVLGKIF